MPVSYPVLRGPQIDTSNWLEAYRQGVADRREDESRNLLKEAGGDIAKGNITGAAGKLYAGGEINAGLALTKYQHDLDLQNRETQAKVVDFFARHGTEVQTPEQQAAFFGIMDNIFGADKVAPLRSVPWPDLIAGFRDKKTELERQKFEAETALKQEELAGVREDRALKQGLYSQFGLIPPTPPPTYTPTPRTDVPPSIEPSAPSVAPVAPSPPGSIGMAVPGAIPSIEAAAAQPALAAPPSAAQPQSPQATPQDQAAAVRAIIDRMSPAQRASVGLLLAKGDYPGVAKMLQEAANSMGIPGQPFGMSGYRWSATQPGTLEPIPGGKEDQVTGEQAARAAMLALAKMNLPEARRIFIGGKDEAGKEVDPALGSYYSPGAHWKFQFSTGDVGHGQRLVWQGVEGILRALTGAAAPDSEVTRIATKYTPRPEDSIATRERKLKLYEQTINLMGLALTKGVQAQELAAIFSSTYDPDRIVEKLRDIAGKETERLPQTAPPTGGGPQPGDIEDGYRFKGGNPGNADNWEPVE